MAIRSHDLPKTFQPGFEGFTGKDIGVRQVVQVGQGLCLVQKMPMLILSID
jgi:hypothetical protein